MFKRYYSELYQKFYVTGKNLPFFFCSVQGKKHFFFLDLTLFLNMSPKLVPCLIMQQSTSQFPIQGSNKISPTKTLHCLNKIYRQSSKLPKPRTMVKKNDDLVWPEFSYFEQQACDFHLEKESMPNIAFFI